MIGAVVRRHVSSMTIINLLFAVLSSFAAEEPVKFPPIDQPILFEGKRFTLPTHVETWCYANRKCTGAAQKVSAPSMCKGEHSGVRTVVVSDMSGKLVKRGKCVPGNLLGDHHGGVYDGGTHGSGLAPTL